MTELIFKAIEFAAKAHRSQYRKGTLLPYIFHPLEVGKILLEAGCSEQIVAAGILHDTLEDTSAKYEDLVNNFGPVVADLVIGTSEPDKKDTWENRKLHTINWLKTAPINVLLIAAADKLSNFQTTKDDLSRYGDVIWKKFNRGKEQQRWYMQSLAEIFWSRIDDNDCRTAIFEEVGKVVKKISALS
ncbi:MAG TPA: HD domain-containing protein [Candidatus Nanoarchaeia archaeon]|nr:HD domain-containing protein [Candidatus Nanoarchaeia archaeon]